MRNKIFSIIIPAYNSESCIERLIGSLIIQKEFIHEVLVCNDRSTDNTVSVVKKYEKALPIKVITTPTNINRSPGNARQCGLDAATGKWVVFADADDLLTFTALSYYLDEIKIHPEAKMIIGSFDEVKLNPFVFEDHHYNRGAWVHGKAFNLKYIKDHDIRFPTEIFTHEDKFFCNLTLNHLLVKGKEPLVSDYLTYYWCHEDNETSIVTRLKGKYAFHCNSESVYAAIEPVRIVKEKYKLSVKRCRELFKFHLMMVFCEMYHKLQVFQFTFDEEEIHEHRTWEDAKRFYLEIKELLDADKGFILDWLKDNPMAFESQSYDSKRTIGQYIPTQSIYDFINILEGNEG